VPKIRFPSRGPAASPGGEAPVVSDVELVAGLARGEEWAAELLYDRLQPVVDRTLRRLLRSGGPDHDDMVQAAFERIIRVLTERKLSESYDLAAWSSVVATRVALDALRRRTRENRLFSAMGDEPERPDGNGNLERHLEARSEIARVQGVIARLRPKYAEALVLHDVLGHDLSEVARLVDVSVSAAQSRLVRGRRELVRRIKGKSRHE
jgi:RNA polymerase sigma-70 factor, ECF subfamily